VTFASTIEDETFSEGNRFSVISMENVTIRGGLDQRAFNELDLDKLSMKEVIIEGEVESQSFNGIRASSFDILDSTFQHIGKKSFVNISLDAFKMKNVSINFMDENALMGIEVNLTLALQNITLLDGQENAFKLNEGVAIDQVQASAIAFDSVCRCDLHHLTGDEEHANANKTLTSASKLTSALLCRNGASWNFVLWSEFDETNCGKEHGHVKHRHLTFEHTLL